MRGPPQAGLWSDRAQGNPDAAININAKAIFYAHVHTLVGFDGISADGVDDIIDVPLG